MSGLRVPFGEPVGQEVRAILPLGLELLAPEAITDSKLMLFKDDERTAAVILYWSMDHTVYCREDPRYDPMIAEAVERHGYTVKHYLGGEIHEYENNSIREEVLMRIQPGRF